MRLDAFADAVVGGARDEARRRLQAAERDADHTLQDARDRAAGLLDQARREGRESAERETRRRMTEARRQARARVLAAQRQAVEGLRRRALELLRQRRGSDEYAGLMERLRDIARHQLGNGTEFDTSRDDGFIARSDSRRVDYRLPTVVDRALDELGSELEEVWR